MDYATLYQSRAQDYDAMIAREDAGQVLLNTITSIAPIRGHDLVDVGAGTGRVAIGLGARGARSVHAVDASEGMLAVLRDRARLEGVTRLTTTVADHEQLPLASACSDVTTSAWSVGHATRTWETDWLPHVSRSISEMRRITRPGGAVIVVETLGLPKRPLRQSLVDYHQWLEKDQGFARIELDTDFVFRSVAEADRLTRWFFGDATADELVRTQSTRLPERTGLWWRRV